MRPTTVSIRQPAALKLLNHTLRPSSTRYRGADTFKQSQRITRTTEWQLRDNTQSQLVVEMAHTQGTSVLLLQIQLYVTWEGYPPIYTCLGRCYSNLATLRRFATVALMTYALASHS